MVKQPRYIPTKDVPQTQKKSSLLSIGLFTLFGCSSSWSLLNSFYCELAWFDETQPEGVDLSAWLGLMQAVSALIVLIILYIDTKLPFDRKVFVYIISALPVLTCLMLSVFWESTVNGVSVFLLSGVIIAAIVGWLQFILIVPWLVRNFNPRMLSGFLAGDGLMTLTLAIMEIIQQPGGVQTFSPKVYFLISGMIYLFSLGVAAYILQNDIEREVPVNIQKLEPGQTSFNLLFFPSGWWKAKRYIFIQLWLVFWTWWVIPVALPFAAENTTGSASTGANYLQWILGLGFLGMLCGYLSSYLATDKFWINETLVLFSLMVPIVILAASDIGDWTSWTMRTILMLAAVMTRVLYGWIIVLLFREIMLRHPENGEALCRYSSLWTLVSSIFILTLQWWLLYVGAV